MKNASALLFCLLTSGEAVAMEKAANVYSTAEPAQAEWSYPEWLAKSAYSLSFEVRSDQQRRK